MAKGTPKQKEAIAAIALPVLVARLGGEVTITEAEFNAMRSRYGPGKLTVEAVWQKDDHSLHLRIANSLSEKSARIN